MDIIQKLKENEKPFGLMSKEMQEKAEEIGAGNFERLWCGIWGEPLGKKFDAHGDYTYRLRPDYKQEPEVIKCKIEQSHQRLMYERYSGKTTLHKVVSHPDFIGFELEGQLWGRLYKHKKSDMFFFKIPANKLSEYEVCNMSDAKVLFKAAIEQ